MDGKSSDQTLPNGPSDQPTQGGGSQPISNSPLGDNSGQVAPPSPVPAADQTKTPVTNVQPPVTTGPGKEGEPVVAAVGEGANGLEEDKIAKEENDEYWMKFSAEIKAEKEAIEAGGIEKIEKGEAPIPPKLAKEMGVEPTPAVTEPHHGDFTVRGVGLSDDQLTAGMKKPVPLSVRWFVEWFIYQLLKAHFLVRKVHGKIVRQKGPSS